MADDAEVNNLRDGTIAYAITSGRWSVYQTADAKSECPDGMNEWGAREIFKALFPDDGTKRSVVDTQLAREGQIWAPQGRDEKFPFIEAKGKVSLGLNLDGKVSPEDFTSPTGEPGVDNQLYRALGCTRYYRGPDGNGWFLHDKYVRQYAYNRVLVELTNVDSLVDDPDVDVAIYRGLDDLPSDAAGTMILPGGTQHIDVKYGKKFESHFKGRIVNGVLTNDPVKEVYWPLAVYGNPAKQHFRDFQFSLNLTQDGASGLIAAYSNIDEWYYALFRSRSTHLMSPGTFSAAGLYNAMQRLADAYPDASGRNTAISLAMDVKFAQVFIDHPPQQTAAAGGSSSPPAR
jgi:hypothetical protein